MSFTQLELIEPILKVLNEQGYENPTPIQIQSIPTLLARKDLLGCAQTGTGKTAAYCIPMLQILHQAKDNNPNARRNIKALILTPTRELSIQVAESIYQYSKYLDLRHTAVYGGVPKFTQVRKLKQGVDILVATPGRLLDLVQEGHVSLKNIEYFVLDEADHMLDLGFINDVKKLITKLPTKRQTILLSATLPANIKSLASQLLYEPVKVEITPNQPRSELIEQSLFYVDKQNKRDLLIHILQEEKMDNVIVFTRTKHGADKVCKYINQSGIRSEAIHGNKSQSSRQIALENFTQKRTKVLVATDIAARGIDVKGISHVINFELPETAETYVHRIGRTGRAGSTGYAFSFCDDEERSQLRDIQKLIKKPLSIVKGHPYDVPFKYSNDTAKGVDTRPATRSTFGPKRRSRTFSQTY